LKNSFKPKNCVPLLDL